MADRLPSSLKWLIDKRARLDGEIKKMQAAANCAKRLIQELSSIKEDLAAVDRTLKFHIIQVETENIAPIVSRERQIKLGHGELTRLLLTCLRVANGAPVSTNEIISFIEERLAVTNVEKTDPQKLHSSVRYRLKNLVKDGVVQRHHKKWGKVSGLWSLACHTTVISKDGEVLK